MSKTKTLWLFLLLLLAGPVGLMAQSRVDTLKAHYEPCIASGDLLEGVPDGFGIISGTWAGPNPLAADPANIYVREHGMLFPDVPTGTNVTLNQVYVWFGNQTRVVGTPDEYNIIVYRVVGTTFTELGRQPFRLDTLLEPNTVPYDQADPLNIYARGGITFGTPVDLGTGGGTIFVSVEVNNQEDGNDDVISLIAFNATCGGPQRWHTILYDELTNAPWSPGALPPTFNEFIGEDLFANFAIGPVFGVENVTAVCDLNLTSTVTNVTCADGNDGSINLTVGGEPIGPYLYTWFNSLGEIVSAIVDPSGLAPDTYTVIVTVVADPTCTKTLDMIVVGLQQLPALNISPSGNYQLPEQRALTVPNNAAYSYQWFLDGDPIAGATTRTYTPTAIGRYTVVATQGPCEVQSQAIVVTDQPQGGTVCVGQCVTLSASSGGTTYLWSPVTGLDNPRSASPQACPRRTTTYVVRITDAQGNVTFSSTTVTVIPEPNAFVTASGPTTFCSEGNVTLSTVNGAFTYQWFRDGIDIPAPAGTQPTLTNINQSGLYAVEVTNDACTKRSEPTLVTAVPATPFEIRGYPAICPGSFTDLQIAGGERDAVFTWAPVTGLNFSPDPINRRSVNASPSATRTYTVSYTSRNGCTVTRNVTVTVSDPIASSITGLAAQYCSGGEAVDTFTVGPPRIGVQSIPQLTPPVANAIRLIGPATYELNLSTAAPGNYVVRWEGNYNGCSFNTTHNFQVVPGVNPTITGLNPAYCNTNNGPINFSATPAGPAGTWAVTPDPLAGGIVFTANNGVLRPSAAGVGDYDISWSGTAANGCAYKVTRTVSVFQNGQPVSFRNLIDPICRSNDPITITALPGGGTYVASPYLTATVPPVANNRIFNPNARNFFGSDTSITIRYTGAVDGCTFGGDRQITITNDVVALIDQATGDTLRPSYCTSGPCINFRPSPAGGFLTGPPGLIDGGNGSYTLCPGILGEGTYQIIYSGVINDCQFAAQKTIRVSEPPTNVALFNLKQRYCTNEAPSQIVGVPPGTITSSLGLVLQNGGGGSYTYNPGRYTGAAPSILDTVRLTGNVGGCDYELVRFVTIVRGQIVSVSNLPDSICTDADPIIFTVTPVGGFWTPQPSPGSIFERVANTEDTYRLANFSGLVDGEQRVFTYNGTGIAGCRFDTTITLVFNNPPSSVDILGIPDVVCNITEPFTVFGVPANGRFSGIGVAPTFGSSSVDPRVPGFGIIEYAGNVGGCLFSTSVNVNVIVAPEIAITGIEDSVCSRTESILITGIPRGSGSLSTPAGQDPRFLRILTTGGGDQATVFPSRVPEGIYRIFWNGITPEGCVFRDTLDVTVTDTLEAGSFGVSIIGLPDTVCIGVGQVPLLVNREVGGTWSGTGVVTGFGAPFFEPGTAGLGLHVISYEGFTPDSCFFFARKSIFVSPDVTQSSITNLPATICSNDTSITLVGVPNGGSYSGSGTGGAPIVENRLEPSSVAPGVYTITYSGEAGGCSFSTTRQVEVLAAPDADIIATDPDDPNDPNPTALCGTASRVVLTADPNNRSGALYSFAWFRNNINLGFAPGRDSVTVSESGRYEVVITNIATRCADRTETVFVQVTTSTLNWSGNTSDIFAESPTGCGDDGLISVTTEERFPGERIEYYINGNGPFSSGFNFMEFFKGLDPDNPDFAISAGVYTIRARDAAGCSIDTTIVVEGNGGPCCPNVEELAIANVEVQDGSATAVWGSTAFSIGFQYAVSDALGIFGDVTTTTDSILNLTSLVEGRTYCVRVRAICDTAQGIPFQFSEWDTTCFNFIAPGACPSVDAPFTFTNVTASTAMVSWTNIRNAVSYEVKVYDALDPTVVIQTINTNTNSANLSGLKPGTNYQVDVRTNCGAGNFGSAGTDFFSTGTICDNISGLTVSDVSSIGATVRWEPAAGAVRYEVTYSFIDGAIPMNITTTSTEIFLTDLDCSDSYIVSVRAFCSDTLSSSETSEIFSTTPCCGSPARVNVTDITTSTAMVSWDRVPSANLYMLIYESLDTPGTPDTIRTTEESIELVGLGFDENYNVQVISVCELDTSGAAELQFSTSDVCENISDLTTNFTTPTTAEVTWLPVRGSRNYLLEYSVDNATWTQRVTQETTFLITGLMNSTTYFVRVRTVCAEGIESNPTTDQLTTLGPCTALTALRTTSVSAVSAMIAWTGSGSATGYSVRYRMAGSSQWTTRQASGSPYTISGLMPETEYEVQVRSICGSSDLSGWSTSLFFFTVRGLACPMPMDLLIDNTTANTATVSWASSENATAYSVQWAVDAGTNPVWNSRNTSATTFTIDNLTPGTAYIIRVRSLCGSQFSDFTATVRTTTIAGRIGASSSDLSINYTVYPNPNRGRFTIQCEAQDLGNFQLKVVDLTGREVYSESFPFAVGANEYPVELPATVSAGVYFLHFTSGDVHQTLKIIVQ